MCLGAIFYVLKKRLVCVFFNEETNTIVCVLHVVDKVDEREKIILFKESTLAKYKKAEFVHRFRSYSKFAQVKLGQHAAMTLLGIMWSVITTTSVKQEEIKVAKQKAIDLQKELDEVHNHSAEPAPTSVDCVNMK